MDSLRLYAIGPAQEVDSATVVRWLGQPQARAEESAETWWWRYADDVVGGQRRIGELRIVRGRLNAVRVLITAE